MNTAHTTGLGEPEQVGKRSLFQPPAKGEEKNMENQAGENHNNVRKTRRRIRTTIELTNQALAILQDIQNRHRLETGKVLPLWRLVSQTIESYGQSHKEKSNIQDISHRGPKVQNTPGASLAHT